MGIANLFGCWFQIYPIAGVLSLAAVVESAGALTPLYTAMAGIGIIIVTSFFVTVFKFLPKPVLGSIVCVGILNLMDIKAIKKIWKISKKDFIVLCCTIIMTLIIGIDYGVLVGVIGSLLMFIYQSTQPQYGRIVKTKDNKYEFLSLLNENENKNKTVNIRNDILILRWDEVLFFGNSQIFKDKIKRDMMKFIDSCNEYMNEWCMIICFDSINQIDFTAIEALHSLIKEIKYKHEECILLFTNLHYNIKQSLIKANLIKLIEMKHIFDSISDAENWWDQNHNIMMGHTITRYKTSISMDKTNNNNNSYKSKSFDNQSLDNKIQIIDRSQNTLRSNDEDQ